MYMHTNFIGFFWQGEVADENDEKHFYESSDSEKETEAAEPKKKTYIMDADHRLLLRTCKPLLNSRNAAVSNITGCY